MEKQITSTAHGHILTNIGVWSPDGRRVVYDVRSDPAGEVFDGSRIETVDVETGAVRVLFEAKNDANCGVASFHPHENWVVFIHGPEHPTPDWQYGFTHRRGVVVDEAWPHPAFTLDARDLTPPFTPGALRGGTHLHVYSGDGDWVSFTYEDHVLAQFTEENASQHVNLRNVGVSVMGPAVNVGKGHARNHDGLAFSVLVTRTTAHPKPGTDEIKKAFDEAWIGRDGYDKANGARQRRALAFLGHVVDAGGKTLSEVFLVDIPDDVTLAGDGPLQGTATARPHPPRGTVQRRLTFTANRKFPGVDGPRHWPRSSPDGSRIAFLMRDDAGIAQLWTISPNGGPPLQLTRNPWDVGSPFSWHPDGKSLAHVMDSSVCVTSATDGTTTRLTPRSPDAAPRPEACVFSPDGGLIAYVRPIATDGLTWNQIFVYAL